MRKTLGVLLVSLCLAPSVSWGLPLLCVERKGFVVSRPELEYEVKRERTLTEWSIKNTPRGVEAQFIANKEPGDPDMRFPCTVKKHSITGKPIYFCDFLHMYPEGIALIRLWADMTSRKFTVSNNSGDGVMNRMGDCKKF